MLKYAKLGQIHWVQYLLYGYVTLGVPETIVKNGAQYIVQRYQGKHKNEFLLRSETGDVCFYLKIMY